MNRSDTPRTDLELTPARRNLRSKMDAVWVDARFAREVERDLSTALYLLDDCVKVGKHGIFPNADCHKVWGKVEEWVSKIRGITPPIKGNN